MTCYSTSTADCNAGLLGPSLTEACNASIFVAFMSLLNALTRENNVISGKCERVKPVEIPDEEYDFVVVGGGAGGAVVAARLSEIPEWKVLLLEAGPDEPAGAEIPGFATTFLGTNIIWNFTTTNESHACLATNGSCAWPSGKNLGGNTVHNGMVYLRGHSKDYNYWAELGNEGWAYDDVLKYFLKAEDNGEIDRVGREYHATGGPLSVERFPYVPPIGSVILDASREVNYGVSEDLNGNTITGFSVTQGTNKNGVRRSSSRAYLWPARERKNLHVALNSLVTRVIVENGRAVGVEYFKDGESKIVSAKREVILAAGVVNSPHLLLLSGIGPKEHLESVGVKVVQDLPGVGENLHDHPATSIPFTVNEADTYLDDYTVAEEYLDSQTGPLSSVGSIQVVGVLASNLTTPDDPDVEIYIYGYGASCAPGEKGALQSTGKRTVLVLASYLHPKSRGRITLETNDPFKQPSIWVNYLGMQEDVDGIVAAINMALKLVRADALRDYNFTMSDAPLEACSHYIFLSDDYWACVAMQYNLPTYHQGGTCKMGPSSDPMAVVDPRLRVYKIKGLRVADASIMPKIVSSNTAAPVMMIGERAAAFIKEDWNRL